MSGYFDDQRQQKDSEVQVRYVYWACWLGYRNPFLGPVQVCQEARGSLLLSSQWPASPKRDQVEVHRQGWMHTFWVWEVCSQEWTWQADHQELPLAWLQDLFPVHVQTEWSGAQGEAEESWHESSHRSLERYTSPPVLILRYKVDKEHS